MTVTVNDPSIFCDILREYVTEVRCEYKGEWKNDENYGLYVLQFNADEEWRRSDDRHVHIFKLGKVYLVADWGSVWFLHELHGFKVELTDVIKAEHHAKKGQVELFIVVRRQKTEIPFPLF